MMHEANPVITELHKAKSCNNTGTKFIVTINSFKVGIVYAKNIDLALHKAAYEYGLNCDVEESPCKK